MRFLRVPLKISVKEETSESHYLIFFRTQCIFSTKIEQKFTFCILRFLANYCTYSLNLILNLRVGNSNTLTVLLSTNWTNSHIYKAFNNKNLTYFLDYSIIICNLRNSPFLKNGIKWDFEVLIHLFIQIIIGAQIRSWK